MKESRLRSLVRQELNEISAATEENLEKLDSIRRSVNRLQKQVSDQSFEGEFTRGEVESAERVFKDIKQDLDELERIFIES